MGHILLPKIGDIITFSGKWNLTMKEPEPAPNGLVIKIRPYATLNTYDIWEELHGTLAYPLSLDQNILANTLVYVIEWATTDMHIRQSYRCINEEWFHNGVFIIVSKA